ncbi:NAD(P)/FAD-dependent oxidoreductase [uncultured Vibrio sp.]|uniref:NAD(P)/FAD-dependent oxidoreductase n=1 Tax=uncultured Vibrio sp. TaxID=114054 RepID=UPI0009163222|nr:NAD(P)/FAD-dependent oxidoreductase [uncultured Vibrio sp.]OIQ25084.1 MAG: amine oxidase [Vibrio sp. MedPE-SWchi]
MSQYDVVIVGAGFTGLTAAYVLSKRGLKVHVVESDSCPGGLAGVFEFSDGVKVEKFYHHWFNNDTFVPELVKELGLEGDVITHPSKTGMYFNGRMWKLSTPLDLLRFKALSFIDRIRLGILVFQVRRIKDWKSIEHLTIREWLEPLCGKTVFKIVWEPLLSSKFSIYSEAVNAVWMWKKLVLRGGTRNDKGGEELAYFKGGFGRLSNKLVDAIRENNGKVTFNSRVTGVQASETHVTHIETVQETIEAKHFIFTPSFPIIANIFRNVGDPKWISELDRVKYLGNLCLVLRLNQSLSDTYWLNVNDPGFPFVGVIEHTNFDSTSNYNGSHIAYLSRYLATEDPVWKLSEAEYLAFALGYIKQMFPHFKESWVEDYKVWRTEFGQHVTEVNYSNYVPSNKTPFDNTFISTMAQIYPEDRGTNYAIREGRKIAKNLLNN